MLRACVRACVHVGVHVGVGVGVYRIAGNFRWVVNFVILGVQFQARKLKPTKISTCVLRLSVRYSSHEIKNYEN